MAKKKNRTERRNQLNNDFEIKPEFKGRVYYCKISSGSGSRASSAETSFSDAEIKAKNDKIQIKSYGGSKVVTGINVGKGIWSITSVFFSVFFVMSLAFNIIFYAFVRSEDSLIIPKILLGIFVCIGFVPLCVSFSRAPRRIRVDLSSYEFIRIIFASRADRAEFLSEFTPSIELNYTTEGRRILSADVSTKDDFFKNADVVPLSKHRFKVVKNNCEYFYSFTHKRASQFSFLYFFFLVFAAFPPLMIISSIIEGTFQSGMLSTLICFVVGIFGMFLPRLLSGNSITLLSTPHDITLEFTDKSQLKEFCKGLKGIDSYDTAATSKIMSNRTVDREERYFILDDPGKIREVIPIVIFGIAVGMMITGCVAMLISGVNFFGVAIFLLATFAFGSVWVFLMRNNFSILKARMYWKKAMRYGNLVYGRISSCETKLFEVRSRIYYFARLMISFTDAYGKERHKSLYRVFHENKQFCTGQTVLICCYADGYTALDCSIQGDKAESERIRSENEQLYAAQNTKNEIEEKLLATKKNFYSLDLDQPHKTAQKKPYFALALIPIIAIFALFCWMIANVIKHNPDNPSQIQAAIFSSIFIGLPLFIITLICTVKILKTIWQRIRAAAMLKESTVTFGYVSEVEEIVTLVRNKDRNYTRTKTFVNVKYVDLSRRVVTKCFYENELSLFSRSWEVGDKIAIAFRKDVAVILSKYTLKNGDVPEFSQNEVLLAHRLIDRICMDCNKEDSSQLADNLAAHLQQQFEEGDAKTLLSPPKRMPLPHIESSKTEVMLGAYIVYSLIFIIIGSVISMISLFSILGAGGSSLWFFAFILTLPGVAIFFAGILVLLKGIKRHTKAKNSLYKCHYTYAVIFNEGNSSGLFRRIPYIYFDYSGKLQKHYTDEIFFQFSYINFARKDIARKIHSAQTLHSPPDLFAIDNAVIGIVAYNRSGATLLRPKKNKRVE